MLKKIYTLFVVMLLCACQHQNLKTTRLGADPFETALVGHYLDIADEQAKYCDWSSNEHFMKKAEISYNGAKIPLPENLSYWNIDQKYLPELQAAHAQIMNLVYGKSMYKKYPAISASAQAHFDCWVEEQEEAWETDEIAKCKNNFYKDINLLQTYAEPPMTHEKKSGAKHHKKTLHKKKHVSVEAVSVK